MARRELGLAGGGGDEVLLFVHVRDRAEGEGRYVEYCGVVWRGEV